jgi:hypothetical protein
MIANKAKIRKLIAFIFWVCAAVGATVLCSTKAVSSEIPPENRYKNQNVTLPPEIATFISAKEQQAEALAKRQNFELDTAIKNYFDAVKVGHIGQSQQLFHDIFEQAHSTNVTGQLNGPIWQVVMDASLAVGAVGNSTPDFVLVMAREMTNSLMPGCIYFGGTDLGRGLPTILCYAPGEPFFVVSQNPLADGAYMELLREEYGSRIQLPNTNEVKQSFDDYTADVQRRQKLGQLKPGENFQIENSKPKIQGPVAVMEINGLIAKAIFDKNPDREFYVEESFPLDWMYSYLLPHKLLMKLNRQPLNEMPADEIQNDEDFWSKELAGKIGDWLTNDMPVSNVCAYAEKVFAGKDLSDFKGDPQFIANQYITAYSHWRSSIAGIYAWRLSPQCPPEYRPKNDAQRKQLTDAADFAFRQAFALCPYSPETVYRYVNFLLSLRRFDDAILIAKTDLACLPKDGQFSHNEQIKELIEQLEKFKNQSAVNNTTTNPGPQQQLKALKELFDQGKIDKEIYEQKKSAILNSL